MEKIISLINKCDYAGAADAILEYMKVNAPDATLYVLSATVNLHFGLFDEAGKNALCGLNLEPDNYELYLLLGDALSVTNADQAYLCYEMSLEYAKEKNASSDDIEYIAGKVSEKSLCSSVRPYDIVEISADNFSPVNERMSGESDILILKKDSKPFGRSLFAIRMAAYSSSKIAMVAPMVDEGAAYRRTDEKLFGNYRITDPDAIEEVVFISDLPVYIKAETIETVGSFDTAIGLKDYGLADYCLRIDQNKKKTVLCHNSLIVGCRESDHEKNREPFINKWHFSPEYYGNARTDLIPFIKNNKNDPIEILEVGCGLGATLEKIRYLFPKSAVHGLEIVESVAEISPEHLDIKKGNIEKDEPTVNEGSLDYIIFGDVLEHLNDPGAVLIRMRQYLKPDGHIIVSLPNIMNASVIRKLLSGFFTYTDSGILDRTHLKFFTYYEARRLFASCGYDVEDESILIIRADSTEGEDNKEFFDKLMQLEGVADRRMFDAFQMHFLLKMIPLNDN